MDLKGIISKEADVIARKHGTTWEGVCRELMIRPGDKYYTEATKRTLSDLYPLSVLTGPEVLQQVFGFRRIPSRANAGWNVRPKTYSRI